MAMSRTKDDLFNEMMDIIPYSVLGENSKPYIFELMQIYADQEAKAYAHWLSNQALNGSTSDKLFSDYKKQFED